MTTPNHALLSYHVAHVAEKAAQHFAPAASFDWWVYAILVFFGILPDLSKWLGHTGYEMYIWLHWNDTDIVSHRLPRWLLDLNIPLYLRFIPTFGLHILNDTWVHSEPYLAKIMDRLGNDSLRIVRGTRYWKLEEGMYREALVWYVNFLLFAL